MISRQAMMSPTHFSSPKVISGSVSWKIIVKINITTVCMLINTQKETTVVVSNFCATLKKCIA